MSAGIVGSVDAGIRHPLLDCGMMVDPRTLAVQRLIVWLTARELRRDADPRDPAREILRLADAWTEEPEAAEHLRQMAYVAVELACMRDPAPVPAPPHRRERAARKVRG